MKSNHPPKRTKIVCTLGPASSSVKTLTQMAIAGLDVVRLNFSHGNYKDFATLLENVREASLIAKKPLAIMQDLQGPKIRIGEMPKDGLKIKREEKIILSTAHKDFVDGKIPVVPVQYKHLHEDVNQHDTILIEDGMIELKVIQVKGQEILCRVMNNGVIKTHKGINAPTASISADPLTAKDLKDLNFGLKNNVDYVAISFVRRADDIRKLRKLIEKQNSNAKIIAKIERNEAIENLEEIIQETDAVMVARGDLGVETPAQNVPIIQKRIIEIARLYGKPVIIATQMLQSMISSPKATRAEVSDAANAIYEYADAFMLSNETAVGMYPVEAVQTLTSVARAIEEDLLQQNTLPSITSNEALTDEICFIAAKLAKDINAKLIAITDTGFTAKTLAKQRVFQDIITITNNPKLQKELALFWGLSQIYVHKIQRTNLIPSVKKFLKEAKILKRGEAAVIVFNVSQTDKFIGTVVME